MNMNHYRVTLSVLLAGLALAGSARAQVQFNPTLTGTAVNTGAEARLRFATTNWDQMVTANGGSQVTANISNNASVLYNNWLNFSLSFNAGSHMLVWQISGTPFGGSTVLAVESDAFNALRIDARTLNNGDTLQWNNLAFSGPAASGALQTSGSVTKDTATQWIVGQGPSALSLNNWSLTGSVLASGGNNEQTKLWISTANVSAVSAVPEPGAAALWIAGLGVCGLLAGKRRRA
jgi:hypothetical protein